MLNILFRSIFILVKSHAFVYFSFLTQEVTGIYTLGMDMDEVPYQWINSVKTLWLYLI